jgi:PAS domain S-box-containing protein
MSDTIENQPTILNVDSKVTFNEIFNLEELQRLQDLFSDANGVSSIITDVNGNHITQSSNYCNLCREIIQKTEKGKRDCIQTDQLLSKHNNVGPIIHQCGNCSLWEAGVNIIVGGKHIGNWIIGQIRHEIINESQINNYAEKIGANRKDFALALNETPVMTIARFKSIAKMLHAFVTEIAEKAYNNRQLQTQIDETEKIKKLLQESKDNYRITLQAAMDGFWVVDLEGNLLEVNNSYCKMSGYSERELLTMKIMDIETHESYEETQKHINKIIEGGEDNFETQHRKKDGRILDVEVNVQFQDIEGGRIVVFLKDISTRKENHNNLIDRNRLIESIVNLCPDMLYVYDIIEQKNIYTNDGIHKILGYSVDEIIEMENDILPKLMHHDDWKHYLKKILPQYASLKDSERITHKYRMIDKLGNWHWIESNEIVYLRNKDSSPKQIFGTGRDVTANFTYQNELLEAEWKFKALFEQGPIGVAYHEMIYDEFGKATDYRFIDANAAYLELTGVDPRGKTVLEAFPGIENDPFDWIGTFGNVAKTGETIRFESYLQSNNRWYDVVGYQYKPNCFVAAFNEITKQKGVEQALTKSQALLQQNEQRLSLALEATSDALWEWNYVTGKTYYTSRWYDMLGYENQEFEMSFETFQKLCHPDDFPALVEKIQSVIETQKSKGYEAEFRMLQKNGSWKWILGRGNVVKRDENEMPLILSGTNSDISEKKTIESALRESETKFRNLIWDLPVGVILQGPNAEIIMSNPIAFELLGLTEDQLLGKTSYDPDWNVIHEDGSPFPGEMHPVPQVIKTLKSVTNVVMGVYHPIIKQRVWLLVDAVPEFNSDGSLRQVLCTFNNITERKKAEEALFQNELYLKETQQIAQLGTYTLDITTGIWTSSEILDEIFGIPKDFDKSIGGWVSIIHPDWQQIMNDYFAQEVVGKKMPFNKEYKIVRKSDNQERWMLGIGRLKYNDLGEPIMMLGTIRDITERKQLELRLQKSSDDFEAQNEEYLQLNEELIQTNEELYYSKQLTEESESRLARAEKVAKIGNWKLNLNTKHMLSSKGARLLYGVENDDLLLEDVQQVPLAEYRPLLDKALADLITKDIPYNVEFKIKRLNDGKIVDIYSIAEYDKEKNIVFGIVYDITERKKAEEEIRNIKILLEKTIEQSPVPMVLVSMPDTIIQMANKACLEFLGVEDEQSYINTTLFDLKPSWIDFDKDGNQNALLEIPLVRSLSGERVENEERSILRKDGTTRYQLVSSYPIYNDNGSIIAAYVIMMDITELKKAELALAESREKFMKIFDRAPVLIAITTIDDGIYIDINSFALSFSGYSRDEVIGRKSTEIGWLNTDGRQKMLESISETGRIDGLEVQFTLKNKKHVWGLVNGEMIMFDNKMCLLTITTDISERKQMEFLLKEKNEEFETQNEEYLQLNEELTQTNEELYYSKEKAEESDRLKSAFLANMSHEIRTPMNGILGFTELLKEPQLTGETRNTYVNIIEKSGNRMLNIINDIISISKVESGQMEVFISETNINEQLDFIHSFFKLEIEQKELQLTVKKGLTGNDAIVFSDKEKIYAVLTNLVKNAIKFTHEGFIELGYDKKGDFFEFYVKDSGVGIMKEQTDLIFERFRQGSELLTRNYEGAGLGLSISKAYVEMLGGKMWVESQFGKGSTFYFTIPFNIEVDKGNDILFDEYKGNEIRLTRKLKILIAEDDESSEMLLSLTLEPFSSKILKVTNGQDAVNTCRNNPDIDLVLMDNKMPIMDGYEATRQIREFNKDVIIISQTAFALPGDREKVIEAGCNDYLPKPFNQKILLDMIKKYF